MKRAISIALVAFMAVTIVAIAVYESWPYQTSLTIDNTTGATTPTPVANTWFRIDDFPADDMIDSNFMLSDAADARLVNAAGSDIPLFAQDLDSDTATWWLRPTGNLPQGASTFYLHTGLAGQTRDQALGLGPSDSVSVPDIAQFGSNTRLTIESLGTTLNDIPTAANTEHWLVDRTGSYGIGTRLTDQVFAYIMDTATATDDLVPNAAGDESNITTATGCATNYQCVDDPVGAPDDAATYLSEQGATNRDFYNVGSPAAAVYGDDIVSVAVHWRAFCNAVGCTLGVGGNSVQPHLKLGASISDGTITGSTNAWTNYSEVIARPGGGAWTFDDLASLQAGITIAQGSGTYFNAVTQVYLRVTYRDRTVLTHSPISTGTAYDVRAIYDDGEFELWVDDVREANTNTAITVYDSNNTVNIDAEGLFERSALHFGAATQLDETANNNDCTNTGAVGASGPLPVDIGGTTDFGGAVHFNGAGDADADLDCGSDATIDDVWDGGGTFEAWIYPHSDGEGSDGRIAEKDSRWRLHVQNEAAGNMEIRFFMDFSGVDGQWDSATAVIPVDSWTHFAVSYDADAVANNPSFYVNGASVAVTETLTPTGTRVSDAGSNLLIGNRASGAATFDGIIEDVRLWTDIRTGVEIAANDTVELAGTEADLQAYWKLENHILDLQYEPDDVAETDEGDAGDGWSWEGTIDDLALSQTATYAFTRDMTDFDPLKGSLEIKEFNVGEFTTPTPIGVHLAPGDRSFDTVTTGANFPILGAVFNAIANLMCVQGTCLDVNLIWWVAMVLTALVVMVGVYARVREPITAFIAGGLILSVGAMIPVYTWFVVVAYIIITASISFAYIRKNA